MSIEKLDKALGVWRIVTESGERRDACGAAVLGSKIYVLGGTNGGHDSTWNAFDVLTNQWASDSSPTTMHSLSPLNFWGVMR